MDQRQGINHLRESSVFKKGKLSLKCEICVSFFVMHFSNDMFIIDSFIIYVLQ